MLVTVVNPLFEDPAVLQMEHDHPPPLQAAPVPLGGADEQRDCVAVVGQDVVKLQPLGAAEGLAAQPEELEDLVWAAIYATEDVPPYVMQGGLTRVQLSGALGIHADCVEVAPDEVGSGVRVHGPLTPPR